MLIIYAPIGKAAINALPIEKYDEIDKHTDPYSLPAVANEI